MMNLLFDQNISFRILQQLAQDFPGAGHVKKLGLENSTDMQIWHFAKENNYTIVTFDADFYELSFLFGQPPKIIWLRTGNKPTRDISDFLKTKSKVIISFLSDPSMADIACLELTLR